eukprot:CAMPEP_0170551052 /NCGR_PEP_ID=MMETSP0211-20121228/9070_1 /TAXON_ID=311385 /ORGANISM="Pseudokeronopsis sp., Strain OXSARD2" /LENGTH=76 /DNA_ID=CAMNT_0010857965 /DNA_START=281 /DNA_END=511 /DNA_ORIENTATION=-
MIALYFLTSAKAPMKARYMTLLYYGYGEDRLEDRVQKKENDYDSNVKMDSKFLPGELIEDDIYKRNKIFRKEVEIE